MKRISTSIVAASRGIAGLLCAGIVAGVGALPSWADDYLVDPVHSRIGFSVPHLGISTVKGAFTNYTGRISLVKDDLTTLAATATVQTASVDTGWKARDEHIKGADFFHAEKYPTIAFEADEAMREGDAWVLVSRLTMHGTTKAVKLPFKVVGPIKDPWGKSRIGFHAELTIDRHDFNVGSKGVTDKLVGDDVTLEIDLEAVAATPE